LFPSLPPETKVFLLSDTWGFTHKDTVHILLLVAVPNYPRPLVMSYEQFEREQRKYGQY